MRHFFALTIGLFAGSALAQNYGTPAGQNAGDNATAAEQLSPPQRPGRRGGVFVLGSTNPYSLGLSTNVGATGSNVRTNSGAGASSNQASIVITNNGVVSTNVVTNAPPAGILYPPPILPGPVPPGAPTPGTRANPATGVNPAAGTRAGETIVLPPAGAVAPPPPVAPPQGSAVPQGETALPPGGIATPPQGTPTPPLLSRRLAGETMEFVVPV